MKTDNCIMPEMPYCPCCPYGNVFYPEGFDFEEGVEVEWICMLEKEKECDISELFNSSQYKKRSINTWLL
jgi:hypothetical protein